MSCKYIDEPPDQFGVSKIRVEYDPPQSDPCFGQDGQAIEYNPQVTDIAGGEAFTIQVFDDSGRQRWMRSIPQHVEELIRRARAKLAPGTIFEIRTKIPTDYGTRLGIAWYTNAELQSMEPSGLATYPGKMNELGGYCYMGTLRA